MGHITIRLDDESIEEIDDEWKEQGYDTRSEYVRDLIQTARSANGGKEAKIDEYYDMRDQYMRKADKYEQKAKRLEGELDKTKRKKDRLKEELQSYIERQLRRNNQQLTRVDQIELIKEKIKGEYPIEISDIETARKKLQIVLNENTTNEDAAEQVVDAWFTNDIIQV